MSRYVYRTEGVCAPEIHIDAEGGILKKVRFVGGGCQGQASLVSKLLRGRPLREVARLTRGIPCREGYSCGDQLSQALGLLQKGQLPSPPPLKTLRAPRELVAFLAHAEGRPDALAKAADRARAAGAQEVVLLGDAVSPELAPELNGEVLEVVRAQKILALRGPGDHLLAGDGQLNQKLSRRLAAWPVMLSLRVGATPLLAFHGGYVMDLPGFSDAGRFGLEVMAVSELSLHLTDESVYPALEALAPDMAARVIIFAHTRRWKRAQLGGRTFLNVGPLLGQNAAGRPRLHLALVSRGKRGVRIQRRSWAA